jgi:hypothetical protein
MDVSGLGDTSKRKKRAASAGARRNAMKDAMPDVQFPGRIKRVREVDEPAAENEEEDD